MNRYFILFACCIPVKGFKRSTICDLQRNSYEFIPNALYDILHNFGDCTIEEIDEYFNFLLLNEFGFYSEELTIFPKINMSWNSAKTITNAIIDFNETSQHDMRFIIPQLNNLFCEMLELRFFYPIGINKLKDYLSFTKDSTLRSIDILIGFNESCSVEAFGEIRQVNPELGILPFIVVVRVLRQVL